MKELLCLAGAVLRAIIRNGNVRIVEHVLAVHLEEFSSKKMTDANSILKL